jgi:hypothetical protein
LQLYSLPWGPALWTRRIGVTRCSHFDSLLFVSTTIAGAMEPSFTPHDKSAILVWRRWPQAAIVCVPGANRAEFFKPIIRMTDPNPANNWDLLASTLGAAPAPDERLKQPAPAAPQPAKPRKGESRPAHAERSAAPAMAANWDMLASELGAAPAPAPVAPPPRAAVAPPSAPEHRRPAAPPPLPESAEESPNFFDERFDFEEPFDLLEAGETRAAGPEPAGEAGEPTEKRPRRRRRRGRRGRGSEQRAAREPGSATPADERPAETDTQSAEETRPPVAGEGVESDAPQSQRRHHDRGQRRRDTRSGSAPEGGSGRRHSAPPQRPPEAGSIASEDLADENLEFGEAEGADEEQPARLGFRGIPTWEEAVGMIITKNLEARPKRSGGGSHHSRGNRGSRDNRGRGNNRGRGDRKQP